MTTSIHSPNTPYPSMAALFDLLVAPVRWAVLEAAMALGMADILNETSNVDEIAARIGIQTDTAGLVYFLDAMVALGLADKENRKYSNTDFGAHFLDSKSPVFMGGLLTNMKAMQHKNLSKIVDIVKNGPPAVPQTEALQNESKWERATAHLAAYQRAGMGAICADLLETLPEFGNVKKILDLGGGPGLIGAEILRRRPEATGVLLDLPAIIRLAEKELKKEGMADRISCIAGDYNETPLGSGYDLIWASHNLYYVKERVSFFQRVKQSLAPNGVLVCLHEGLTGERTAPSNIVLMRLSLSLEGQDFSFAKGEIAACLTQAGFKEVNSTMLDLPAGQAELVVAR
ncbi:O-methyltransferase, family II [Desulfosarcina variabilis str. Montpellier]|uniref:methyltransferase n=1 Tax=Desulfosarcina variabilis TaxID=2300 RepID=UPI003AFA779A